MNNYWPVKAARKPKKRVYHEHNIQCALMQWADVHPILKDSDCGNLLIYLNNGNAPSRNAGYRAVAAGEKKGVPDLFLPLPCGDYHGLWIELKSAHGVMSREQKQWQIRLRSLGYAAVTAFALDEAIKEIENYLVGYK